MPGTVTKSGQKTHRSYRFLGLQPIYFVVGITPYYVRRLRIYPARRITQVVPYEKDTERG